MNKELQQSKLRLSIGSNSFENINESSIKKVREQRKQDDAERVIEADQLFEKYFLKKICIAIFKILGSIH